MLRGKKCDLTLLVVIIISLSFSSLSGLGLRIYAQNESTQGISPDEKAENQLKIRCSNGSLVQRVSECSSSDQCPSTTPSGNDTLQCTANLGQNNPVNGGSDSSKENSEHKMGNVTSRNEIGDTGQFQDLTVRTDKETYSPGEVVNIIVKNSGTEPLTFPNSALGLKIENNITHEKYPIFSAQVITTLDSGGEKSLKWDQVDSSGNQVKEGNYMASVSSGHLNASQTFMIAK